MWMNCPFLSCWFTVGVWDMTPRVAAASVSLPSSVWVERFHSLICVTNLTRLTGVSSWIFEVCDSFIFPGRLRGLYSRWAVLQITVCKRHLSDVVLVLCSALWSISAQYVCLQRYRIDTCRWMDGPPLWVCRGDAAAVSYVSLVKYTISIIIWSHAANFMTE